MEPNFNFHPCKFMFILSKIIIDALELVQCSQCVFSFLFFDLTSSSTNSLTYGRREDFI